MIVGRAEQFSADARPECARMTSEATPGLFPTRLKAFAYPRAQESDDSDLIAGEGCWPKNDPFSICYLTVTSYAYDCRPEGAEAVRTHRANMLCRQQTPLRVS
jgi:hypothetical protein